MIRPALASLLLTLGPACAGAALAQDVPGAVPGRGLLAAPGDYSFGPRADATAGGAPGGVASVTYGSRNLSAASIQMDSGLIGHTGTRAFVALEAAHGPDLLRRADGSRAGVVSQGTTIGLEKAFPDGTTVSIGGGWEHDRLRPGQPREMTYASPPP